MTCRSQACVLGTSSAAVPRRPQNTEAQTGSSLPSHVSPRNSAGDSGAAVLHEVAQGPRPAGQLFRPMSSSSLSPGLFSSTCHLLGLRPKEQWPPRVRDSQSNGSSTEREPNCAIAIQFSLTSHWPKHVPWPSPKSKEGRFPRLP